MEAKVLTPTEFLLARIAEDEAVAQATLSGYDPLNWEDGSGDAWRMDGPVDGPSGYGSLIVDPARVLAECEAKRRIVYYLRAHEEMASRVAGVPSFVGAQAILEHLALPYADHPDFRPEWRTDTMRGWGA